MPLTGKVLVEVDTTLTTTLDVGVAAHDVNYTASFVLTDGTGANQANNMFTDIRTLAASANESLDMAGVLTNAFGATLSFTKIKALVIKADATNTNDVLVGGAASNQFGTLFGDVTDVVKVKPGGFVAFGAPDANGYAVTAATGDLLKIANSGSGTAVTYTIIVVGVA